MTGFTDTLFNVLLTLAYIIPGFLLCRVKKADPGHLSTMSSVLIYICSPCMIINALLEQAPCSASLLIRMGEFAVLSFAAMCCFMLLAGIVTRLKGNDSRFQILQIASVMGNVGFFGLPIVRVVLPDHPEATAYSAVFVLTMNLLAFTVGVYRLTGEKKYVSVKHACVNPTTISFIAGLILLIAGVEKWMPQMVRGTINTVGNITTPMCMFILGIRLGSMDLKKIFAQPLVYIIAVCKLLAFPVFAYLLSLLLPIDEGLRVSLLVLGATPCASVILNLAEIHGNHQELAADCALLSTIACFLTIPLIAMIP